MRSWLSQKPNSEAPEEKLTLVAATIQSLKDIGWAPSRLVHHMKARGMYFNDKQVTLFRQSGSISFSKFNAIIANLPTAVMVNFCVHLLCNLGVGAEFLRLQDILRHQKPMAWYQVQEPNLGAVLNTASLRLWLLIHFEIDASNEEDLVTNVDPAISLIEVDGKGWIIPDCCYAAKLREDDSQLLTPV